MEGYSLKIVELGREENHLNIGIRIKAPYDPTVREPKVAIIFDNGKEKRRVPLLVHAYFPEENLERCMVFAKYTYNMDYLFFKMPQNERIEFSFEFIYGDNVISDMPFTISGDVKVNDDAEYKISFSKAMDNVIYERKEKLKQEPRLSAVADIVLGVIKEIWALILLAISLILLPIFIVEGILAFFGGVERTPKNNKTGILYILNHIRWRLSNFSGRNLGFTGFKLWLFYTTNKVARHLPVKKNRVVFISNRRDDLSGNFEFIYDILKTDKKLDFRFVLDSRDTKSMGFGTAIRYGYHAGTASVILIDDFTPLLYRIPRREGTTLIQLWHACGAFKTFGYSRLGKVGGQKQASPNHRNYDYAIVSSKEIAKFYAEGFGISLEKAVATGVPRTDIFFDAQYKEKVQSEFYQKYPQLKDKKILIFAPTFRGNGKMSGFYPVDKFDVTRVYEELDGEYAIIIKHHPFVQDRSEIPEKYKDVIIDLSENSELNDLLFVADLLITDYSSVIFEAALLDIPMLFYAYDLQRYIATRGFYYEYEKFVPGKIVRSFKSAMNAIREKDFETEKIEAFKTRFFDDLDGKSSQRTVDLIYKALQRNNR